jgi:hypothetical protein
MAPNPDDLLPGQRKALPSERELRRREKLWDSRLGRWARPWSLVTAAVAILVVIACVLLLRHAPG